MATETKREGNLEAPTRHPIDWKNPEYYDEEKLNAELERVFDICHGCRRCLSLCHSFPTLFDLIDDSETMEVDGVAKKDYVKVVDECYLCDMCYMAKCPYVPPHSFNVDFPHLMLQAKAVKHQKNGMPTRDKILSDTDGLGKLAGIPVITETINTVNHWKPVRKAVQSVLGVHEDAWLPEFARKKLRQMIKQSKAVDVKDGDRTPGKVALFATCYINYNEPGIGTDMIKVLEHNNIPWVVAEKEVCCGMPKLEQGDLEAVDRLKRVNIPHLAKLAREGYAILAGSELLTPEDIEAQYNVSGGHWHHGELSLDQSFMMRPVHGSAQYDTPIDGLYLCGAGTHPGGGLTGVPGHNAAQRIIDISKSSN